jgi:hypothetical protein
VQRTMAALGGDSAYRWGSWIPCQWHQSTMTSLSRFWTLTFLRGANLSASQHARTTSRPLRELGPRPKRAETPLFSMACFSFSNTSSASSSNAVLDVGEVGEYCKLKRLLVRVCAAWGEVGEGISILEGLRRRSRMGVKLSVGGNWVDLE